MNKNLVCAIYNHPEAYPPTLNAIGELSKIYDKVYLIYQPNLDDEWQYPENIFLIKNGKKISIEEQAHLNYGKKILLFLSFTVMFLRTCIKYKPKTILVYDSMALYSYHIFKRLLKVKHLTWYHNHDVIEKSSLRKHSIGWRAAKAERQAFKYLSVFSLPSNERKKYFDFTDFKGRYFHLPNFPSLSFYKKFEKSKAPAGSIKLIYQGTISAEHGIEEVMKFISQYNANTRLLVIGNIKDLYKKKLTTLSEKLEIGNKFEIRKPVNYADLPPVTASSNIGLAINKPENIIYATGGTASNKIYEYAANGLPVLYFDDEHYKLHLSKYSWAFCTDLSAGSLNRQIEYICLNYEKLSSEAVRDFETDLNFEKSFAPLASFLQEENN